ncbi:hypothetical protein [Dyadobacter sp. CY323]|uniref:hypothetical protein n=1 Tax=Dyadobacter sp. CY323 TaxID=2907302 RepID=UPI001F1AA6C2|nr:hypothetical protein [Dyadobacter sp. CY323]MCE6993050.1 hypothetical protein [Dyadobacter sp. CY323]
MQNMLLATPILSDAATIIGSTASGSLGINNLKTPSLKEVYRAANAASVFIIADLGSAKTINMVALIGHSGSSRSYARIRGATSQANLTAAPGYDSGLVPFRSHQSGYDAGWASGVQDEQAGSLDRNMFFKKFADQTFRWWQIDIVDPNSVYLDIGRIYISKAWQPEVNMDYGLAEGWIDPSRKSRTVSGEMIPLERKKFRYADFTFSYATQDEVYNNAFEIERLRGRTKDVLYINDPDATAHLQRRSIYGTLEGFQPIINTAFSIFQKTFRIEEIPS